LQVTIGSTSSTTVTVPEHDPVFPLLSVTVTVVEEGAPTLAQLKEDAKEAAGGPQLSFFVLTIWASANVTVVPEVMVSVGLLQVTVGEIESVTKAEAAQEPPKEKLTVTGNGVPETMAQVNVEGLIEGVPRQEEVPVTKLVAAGDAVPPAPMGTLMGVVTQLADPLTRMKKFCVRDLVVDPDTTQRELTE
jgi:hypothetical protein